ncbi:MAG: hypothetical protein ACREON_09670 [Gemmatimonadaceae bacterium]
MKPSMSSQHDEKERRESEDDTLSVWLGQRDPYEVLLGEIDTLITEWRNLVRPEPWAKIPLSRLIDSLPEILPRLIRLARNGAHQIDEELKERISDDHGWARREDDVPLSAVAEEWAHLKRACWRVLGRNGFVDGVRAEAMQRLDALIDDALGYTLRGYYREELDSLRGRGLERRDRPGNRRAGPKDRRSSD